jgi:glycosyltransferase involved in cell wall biosynthesis/SAM-dependent methyltransferase
MQERASRRVNYPTGAHPVVRVLLQRPAPDYFGGGVLHVEKTREHLTALGIDVDLTFDLEPDLGPYDLVHLFNTPKAGDLFVQCANAQRHSRPVVVSSIYWDEPRLFECLEPEEPRSEIARIEHMAGNQLYAAILGEADVVLTASSMEQGWLTRDFGIAPDKQRVVPLAAEPFFARGDPKQFIERFGLRDFVLCSAQLGRSKNQLRLIRALRGFAAPLVLVYIHAEPDYEQQCRAAAGANVLFVGALDQQELASAYAAAKVHVLVSCYEPTGLATIEAGLAGCNLVCTAHSPIGEYVGNRAWYADPLDTASIRRAVDLAHRVPKSFILRNELLAHFTWEHTAQLTLAAYEGLLAVQPSLAHRKGEARYRWLVSFRDRIEQLRATALHAATVAPPAPVSTPRAAAARIDELTRALKSREAELESVTRTWAYRLHHRLATSVAARAVRRLRNPPPPPAFAAPRGPALDALAQRSAELRRVLMVADATGWHVRRAVADLRRALPDASLMIAGTQQHIAAVRGAGGDVSTLELTRTGYGELTGLYDAIVVVGEVDADAVKLAERSGAVLLVQYNTAGYFAGSAVISSPEVWERDRRHAARRRPFILASVWPMSRLCRAYARVREALRRRDRLGITCVGCATAAPGLVVWGKGAASPYVRCPHCGLVQLARPPSAAALTEIYEDRAAFQGYLDTREEPVTRFRHERILEHISHWTPPGRLLDVGCADGRFLEVARAGGWEVEGIEASALFAREAEKLMGPVIHHGAVETVELPAERFDAVNMSHLFEHVPNPGDLLRRARELLKRGGVLAISTPNVESLAAVVMRGKWVWSEPDRHTVLPSRKTLLDLLEREGFQILDARTVAPGRIIGNLWTSQLFRLWPAAVRQAIEQREPQLNEYLAAIGMGEELLVVARKPA